MAIKSIQYPRKFLVYVIGPTMVGLGEKISKIKVLRWLENAILNLVFANIVFDKRAMLMIF